MKLEGDDWFRRHVECSSTLCGVMGCVSGLQCEGLLRIPVAGARRRRSAECSRVYCPPPSQSPGRPQLRHYRRHSNRQPITSLGLQHTNANRKGEIEYDVPHVGNISWKYYLEILFLKSRSVIFSKLVVWIHLLAFQPL